MLTLDRSSQILAIPEMIHTMAWQQSQTLENPAIRWQNYLNQVCLETMLPWLEEKFGGVPTIAWGDLATWQIENGSAVALDSQIFVLVPLETRDHDEFSVPQIWIDQADHVGDYYLAVEVDTDEQLLYIWGYTTHLACKTQGLYDAANQTYTLNSDQMIQDMSVLWVMQQFAPEPTRASLTTPPQTRPVAPAIRLGQPVIPDQPGTPSQTATPGQTLVNLGQWLEDVFETGWQAIETILGTEPDLAFNFRREGIEPRIQRVKRLRLDDSGDNVLLAVRLDNSDDGRRRIWVQVLPEISGSVLPAGLQLDLMTLTGEVIQSVQSSSQSNYIQLRRFKCEPGTEFQIAVMAGSARAVEHFVS
jgi:hypothetical protein